MESGPSLLNPEKRVLKNQKNLGRLRFMRRLRLPTFYTTLRDEIYHHGGEAKALASKYERVPYFILVLKTLLFVHPSELRFRDRGWCGSG